MPQYIRGYSEDHGRTDWGLSGETYAGKIGSANGGRDQRASQTRPYLSMYAC